jgi:hypothetical protein
MINLFFLKSVAFLQQRRAKVCCFIYEGRTVFVKGVLFLRGVLVRQNKTGVIARVAKQSMRLSWQFQFIKSGKSFPCKDANGLLRYARNDGVRLVRRKGCQ